MNECSFCGEYWAELGEGDLCKYCDDELSPIDNYVDRFIYDYVEDGVSMNDLAAGIFHRFGAIDWIDQLQKLIHSGMIVRIKGFGYRRA